MVQGLEKKSHIILYVSVPISLKKSADPIKKAFGKKARPKWRQIRKCWAPNETRSENVMPQMKANRIWCSAPNCCPTLLMILHLKRGGRVVTLFQYTYFLLWILPRNFYKVRKYHTKELMKNMCLWFTKETIYYIICYWPKVFDVKYDFNAFKLK